MINYFKKTYNGLFKTRKRFSNLLSVVTGKKYLNQSDLDSIEVLLMEADLGWEMTDLILGELSENQIVDGDWKEKFFDIIKKLINEKFDYKECQVIIVVGINGSGKTTSCGKLAKFMLNNNEKVLLVGSDTYRAAANQQIEIWSKKINVDLVFNPQTKDPAAISYDGVYSGLNKNYDKIIIDTAGRLHTSKNLMQELNKIKNVVGKLTDSLSVLIVLDANTGQNGINQIKEFQKYIDIDGIILTKLDGTAKGGIVVNIMHSLGIPVRYIGVGEGADDFVPFNIDEYLYSLLDVNNEK